MGCLGGEFHVLLGCHWLVSPGWRVPLPVEVLGGKLGGKHGHLLLKIWSVGNYV